jgi:hypothetical protein
MATDNLEQQKNKLWLNVLLSLLAISGASQLLDQLCDLRCGGLWPELNSGPEQEVF